MPFQPPASANRLRDLAAITSIADLPPYIAEGVRAVAEAVQISRKFTNARGTSISNASERFRVARRLGWIVPVKGQHLPREGIRYTLQPPKAP